MLLKSFVEQYPSQAKAVNALKNVSEATIINIRRGDWESISDDMWRNVGKQVGWNSKAKWQIVHTKATDTLINFFDDAREFGNVFAITADAGSGKSFISEWYETKRENVYVVSCSEYFNRKTFLQQILIKMGKPNTGLNVPEMMDLIVEISLKKELPLLILDEFDKVSDSILYFFITLYNRLEGNMGIIMMATDYLAKRILAGKKKNKKGYAEIYSRIGRRFAVLPAVSEKEVNEISRANGITDPQDLTYIYNGADGDLRRVKRAIHKCRLRTMKKAA